MKLVIQSEDVKRELTGSFAICAAVDDLERLRAAIEAGLEKARLEGSAYGWLVEVHPSIPGIGGSPLPWSHP